ncbi:MAG: MarR family transcriptional regulator [Syntrophobacteraceae bacterium CG23_combo_of_CG06-09_8_20_14_all_50_8]|nr:MAG: MarR family transcriptional regulator [Syntrophobacteraceae bacterium CG23_combo_of_CG06-09_8_20_14_all_50_8]
MDLFLERHSDKISGVLSCWDRVVITGTIPGICYAQGMTSYLYSQSIRIFDYPKWAEPLRDQIRNNAEKLAAEANLEIEFIRKNNFRKEQRVRQILNERGEYPGLVHIFSAMETCSTYKPWHDKTSGRTFVKPATSKCLHYYFYFVSSELGLSYLRVPTWAPFRLQFYFNGHNALAAMLTKNNIGYQLLDNTFVHCDDWDKAQHLSDGFTPESLKRILDEAAEKYCPVIKAFPPCYWSLMQVEYATDIVFYKQESLRHLYDDIARTAIHSVKPEHVSTFLGRKPHPAYQDEIGNNFSTRIEGTCIKHHMGKVAIKMYDKHSIVLRIETTANDVSFFKHHRKVEHRDGTESRKVAPLKKTIYSLVDLRGLLFAANRRYLDFVAAVDDPTNAIDDLDKLSRRVRKNGRSFRGFNLFSGPDLAVFHAIIEGGANISGFRNRDLQQSLSMTGRQASTVLKRLREHGLIKKIGGTFKYYLTMLGRRATATGLKLREMAVIPLLRGTLATSV